MVEVALELAFEINVSVSGSSFQDLWLVGVGGD